ncbi:MAG: MFS transporter [Planctomycetes bacterium]|nr:MFS transporter [Planctomycetota bacterium]
MPGVYVFFAVNLAAFFVLFRAQGGDDTWTARTFYVWASVFNLFVLSVFWSLMADLFTLDQAKRLFGIIGVGGTAGAIVGAATAWNLAEVIGEVNLMIISVALLFGAAGCGLRLTRMRRAASDVTSDATPGPSSPDAPTRSSAFTGFVPVLRSAFAGLVHVLCSPYLLGVSLFLLFLTLGSTIVYFVQAELVEEMFASRDERTRVFALIDLLTNVLTVLIQLFLTGRIIRLIGVGPTLALLPAVTVLGFLALAAAPVLVTLVVFHVARRASNYALSKPARESLFIVLSREDKYKAKNFVDTFVYRGGDVVGVGFKYVTEAAGLGVAGVSVLCAPLMLAWIGLSLVLGRAQRRRAEASTVNELCDEPPSSSSER